MARNESVVPGHLSNLKLPRTSEVEQYLSRHPECAPALVCHLKSLTEVADEVRKQLAPIAETGGEACTPEGDPEGYGTPSLSPEYRLRQCPLAKFLMFDKNIAKACGVKTAILVENISLNIAKQFQGVGNYASVRDVSVSFSQEEIARYLGIGRHAVRQAIGKAVASGYITTSPGSHCGQLRYSLTEKSAYRARGGASAMSLWRARVGDLGVMKDWAATVLCGFRARIRANIEEEQYPHDGRYSWIGSVSYLHKKYYTGYFSRHHLNLIIKELLDAGRLVRTLCDRSSGTYEWALGEWDENDLLWEMVTPRNGDPYEFLDHQFVRPVPWESFSGAYPPWATPNPNPAVTEEAE